MDLMEIRRRLLMMGVRSMEERTGTILVESDTQGLSFDHGLSKAPTIVEIYTADPTGADGSNSPVTFRSIVACVIALNLDDAKTIGTRGYNSSGTPIKSISTSTVTITQESVTVDSGTAGYTFKAGKQYTWRAIV